MTGDGARTRVAVLGGGAAGVSAAFELTATPELRKRFEVTIYTAGWRLGGKGASGRNAEHFQRIEEHGLHIWFGFYECAFDLMRRCYEELGEGPYTEAFTPLEHLTLWELDGDLREAWTFPLPDLALAEREPAEPGAQGIVRAVTEWLKELWWEMIGRGVVQPPPPPPSLTEASALAAGAPNDLSELEEVGTLLGRASTEVDDLPGRTLLGSAWKWRLFGGLCDYAGGLFKGLRAEGAITLSGVFDRTVIEKMDEQELGDWLSPHLVRPETLDGSYHRVLYDLAFAYHDGDPDEPRMAAGMAVQTLYRILFAHRGSFMLRMEGGMGDVVFAPLLRVLQDKRDVRVEFFTWVDHLALSNDKARIEEIEVTRQAEACEGGYEPLERMDRDGSLVWPSKPRWDYLQAGDSLRRGNSDFERGSTPDRQPTETLRLGADFDKVVLAIPVGGLRSMTDELAEVNPDFRAMLDHSATVMTQSLQVWLTKELKELELVRDDHSITGADRKPFDTLCDMTHILKREGWPENNNVKSIAYLCGVLPDCPNPRVRVSETAEAWIASHPGMDGSIEQKYFRANWASWERYVLTPPGSTRHRLAPEWDGFQNLVLAGDWTETYMNVGCVEAAVVSGRRAAEALRA